MTPLQILLRTESSEKLIFTNGLAAVGLFFFSHLADFTPVCTTEMGRTAQLADKFAARHTRPLGLSTDTAEEHLKRISDVNETLHTELKSPIVADPDLTVAKLYDMIHPQEIEDDQGILTKAFIATETIGDAQGAVIGSLMYVGAFAGIVIVASGGALAAALAGIALGGSSTAIGIILARFMKQHHADYIADQLEKGGLLLWVRTWDEKDEAKAIKVLSAHSAHDVHVHALPA